MDGHIERRIDTWLSLVRELMQAPRVEFPVEELSRALASTFDVTGVFWSWRAANGSFGYSVTPQSLRDQGEGWDLWEAGELFDVHPLVQWHTVTNDTRPQTFSRVPSSLVARKDREFVGGLLRTFGCEEQLTIPCHVDGIEHQTFVLARSGTDFSDDDLVVARCIQPSLTALHHEVDLLDRLGLGQLSPGRCLGLTARELVVLKLLGGGHSTRSIARRLAASPRTIEKHLEHIYRKIHVNDRLNAVRVAQEAGLVFRSRSPHEADLLPARRQAISGRTLRYVR
jgi:DNA-binding CsgD family transcriptional regulator